MTEAESEVFRTIQLDYVMPAGVDWDGFEQKVIDGFVDAVQDAGGEMESASAGPYRPEPERTEWEEAELETLRGIARQVRDGWWLGNPVGHPQNDPEDYIGYHWWRHSRSGFPGAIQREPMTAAEVEAIYGQKENASDGE